MTDTPEHASSPLRTAFGDSILHCFSFGSHEEDTLLCLAVPWEGFQPLVRVQSACYTAEIFRSTDCDCHEQLRTSLRAIHDVGGLLVYTLCDGRGAGLLTKVRALGLFATDGVDTHDAYEQLGVDTDPRSYDRVASALRYLDVDRVQLLTNNPRKIAGLIALGLTVERVPLQITPTSDSLPYLETKRMPAIAGFPQCRSSKFPR